MASTEIHGHEAERANVRGRRRLPPSNSSDSEEGDDDRAGEIMPKWKLYLAGAAIFLCFALLYPSVFSPMISSVLGGRGKQQPVVDQHRSPLPPDRRGGQSPMPEGRDHGGFRPHMHPSSMRMPHAEAPPGGGGRGGFSWLLPFYTVGVVGFLLYTLSKIMFKPKKERKRQRASHLASWEGSEADEDEGDDKQTRSMQMRLRKTEEAMKKILDQLEDLAHGPTYDAGNKAKESGNQHGNLADKLNAEQVKTMEKGLRELKVLSDLCKKQKAAVRDVHISSCNTSSAEDSDINDNHDCGGQMAAEECVYEQAESSQSIGENSEYKHDLQIKSTKEFAAEEGDDTVGGESRLSNGGKGTEEKREPSTQATVERTHTEEGPPGNRSKARRRRQRRER